MGIKFFPEKYFIRYLSERTELFCHMTARPLDPASRRRPASAAVALVLVMVAVLLAAGCVSQGPDAQTHNLPEEKYVYLHHDIYYNVIPVSGECLWAGSSYRFPVSFDERNGLLTLDSDDYGNESINKSLILFYGSRGGRSYNQTLDEYLSREQVLRGGGEGVYSLPKQVSDNITIDSITGDGTVTFRFNDKSIVLKPKERWENFTRKMKYGDFIQITRNTSPSSPVCSDEIITTNRIYNAGVFDKKKIVITKSGWR